MKVEEHLKEKLENRYFNEVYELDKLKIEIIKEIIRYRVNNNLSQGQLARMIKVSQQQISKIENGEFSNLANILKVLSASGSYLYLLKRPSEETQRIDKMVYENEANTLGKGRDNVVDINNNHQEINTSERLYKEEWSNECTKVFQ